MKNAIRKVPVLVAKDLRHIWPQLLVVWPLVALFTTNDLEALTRHMSRGPSQMMDLLFFASILAIVSLVVTIVHGEPLVGDRQYWLTRPFTWHHLLAAKAIAIFLCVNLPLFAGQAVALAVHGVSPVAYFTDLFWLNAIFSAFVLLPVAALAAMTRSLGQFVLALVLAALPLVPALLFSSGFSFDSDGPWVVDIEVAAIFFTASAAVLLVQYARRRQWTARLLFLVAMLGAGAIALATPWHSGLDRFSVAANFHLSLDPNVKEPPDPYADRNQSAFRPVAIELPVIAEGLPADADPWANHAEVTMYSEEPPAVRQSTATDNIRLHSWNDHGGKLQMVIEHAAFDRLKGAPVTIRGEMYFTVMTKAAVLDDQQETLDIPDFGICSRPRAACYSPQPHVSISLVPQRPDLWPDRYARIVSIADTAAPFPTAPLLYPLQSYRYQPSYGAVLVERPVGRYRYRFEFRHVHLGDYARAY